MVQNIIFILVIFFLMIGTFWGMWKLSKWLVIPIQIILFILLITVVIKVFINKDNAEKLNDALAKSGVAKVEERAVSGAVNAIKECNRDEDSTAESEQISQTDSRENDTISPSEKEPQISLPAEREQKQPARSDKINLIDML